jgi:hypothetical protein
LTACLTASLLTLSSCTKGNFRSDLGDGTMLPSLSPADDRPEHALADTSSTNGLSRSNWKPTVIGVPVYGVASNPTYTSQYRLTHETHRQRGEFPSAASSLDQFGDTNSEMRAEALATPFVFVGDIILLLPRMIITPPATEVRGPQRTYARSDMNTARRPLAAPAPVAAAKPPAEPAEPTEVQGGDGSADQVSEEEPSGT